MTNKMEVEDQHHLQSYSSMPLLSRIHCLDSAMKDVEKTNHKVSSTWRNGTGNLLSRRKSRKGMLLTAATSRNVGSKSSVMDRIRSLEDRLLQLSKEIDQVNKASSSSCTQTASLWTISSSSSAQIKTELPVSSYPSFHITQESKQSHEYFQKDFGAPRQRMKNSDNDMLQQLKQKSDNAEEKAYTDGKKKRSPCWQCMKLLGC